MSEADEFDPEDEYGEGFDELPYEAAENIDPAALAVALRGLTLFGDDPYLSMQATNLGIVDGFLTQLEMQLMRLRMEQEGTPFAEAAFLSAQSQMWIFAAYEALRTWRQRAKDVIKLAENGGLGHKIAALEADQGFTHHARLIRADQLRRVQGNPKLTDTLRQDLKRIHMPFARMEALRISLAKHEEGGRRNSIAYAPGYGRINLWCGAIDYELTVGRAILGTISHRDIANDIRAIATIPPPTDEDIASFDEFMKGPPASPV